MEFSDFSLDFFNIEGKVTIVTGGNKGIGQGFVLALAGVDVYATYRSDEVESTIEAVEKLGRRIEFIRIDLTDEDAATKIIDGAIEAFGHIDILINNAGTIRRAPFLEYT